MRLYYRDYPLHDLGRLVIQAEGGVGEPPEAPDRWRRELRVRLVAEEEDYASNRAQIKTAEAQLKTAHGRLRWEDDAGHVYLDQDVTVQDPARPEGPDPAGTSSQELAVAFTWYELGVECGQATVRFRPEGAVAWVSLGRVAKLAESIAWSRVDPNHDHRDSGGGRLDIGGALHCAYPAAEQAARRASLLAQKDALLAAFRSRSRGTLAYAGVERTVRVDGFEAQIDQEDQKLTWSGSFSWRDFLSAAGWAQVKFRATTSEDAEAGSVMLLLDGEVAAASEEVARAKLASLRAATAPAAQWVPIGLEAAAHQVNDVGTDGGDGQSHLRLAFTDRYRKLTGDIVAWELRIEDQHEVTAGLLRTSYTGAVTARGVDDAAAWAAAMAKARALGDRKFQFRVAAREVRRNSAREDGRHVVQVEFAYEYRRQGERVYAEVRAAVERNPFGTDLERVQGRIVGPEAEVQATYAALKAGFTGLLRAESRSPATDYLQTINMTNGALTSGREPLVSGLEFSLDLVRAKNGQDIGLRYEIEVDRDLRRRKRLTTLSGSVNATNAAAAEAYLATFISSLGLGTSIRSNRRTTQDKGPNVAGGSLVEAFGGLQFSETYEGIIEGEDAILETELDEDIRCSGTRRVVQATAASTDVVQACGTQSGTRSVRGRVVALTEATALVWVRRMRLLPYLGTAPGARYETPPELRIRHETVAGTSPVPRAGTYGAAGPLVRAGISAVTVEFTFSEILPIYDPLA